MTVPVIAIDGPAASGKGTIAQRAADALGWHYLDSGALYRLARMYSQSVIYAPLINRLLSVCCCWTLLVLFIAFRVAMKLVSL